MSVKPGQPQFRRRYVIACLNQASLYLARNAAGDVDLAIRRADEAVEQLSTCSEEGDAHTVLVSSAWAIRAASFARKDPAVGSGEALKSARIVVEFVADLEIQDSRAAEAGIKARHAQCAVLAKLIAGKLDGAARQLFVNEAVATVDSALAVARVWEARGLVDFTELSSSLFRFGLGVIEMYQPHAVGTFCLRHLDPELASGKVAWRPDLVPGAIFAMDKAISHLLHQRIAESSNPQLSDYYLDALNALCPAVERLREIDASAS